MFVGFTKFPFLSFWMNNVRCAIVLYCAVRYAVPVCARWKRGRGSNICVYSDSVDLEMNELNVCAMRGARPHGSIFARRLSSLLRAY